MIDRIVRLDQVKFLKVFSYVFKGFTLLHITTAILVLVLMGLDDDFDYGFLLSILFVYIAGVLLSATIHEYAHLWCMKKLTPLKQVRIVVVKTKFSIRPLEKIKGGQSIVIACAGPLTCITIAAILFFVRTLWFEHNFIMLLLGISYSIHALSFWPFSGDGLMIVKGIIHLLKEDS